MHFIIFLAHKNGVRAPCVRCRKCMMYTGGEGEGGLRFSSERDDRRIFWGGGGVLKFSIPGFFLDRKIWQVFFGGNLI